ncbi:MAG: lipocalin family protein [Firmicutes bacterium]|nr:lipocalin family protein [Bacillota bacterium]MCM1400955.1 lipocalin family protein [Bacteroides sp.]MCM1476306.1 lipocalin family protein [Bacteroides sp.]
MKKTVTIVSLITFMICMAACNGLSDRAKEMVGVYYQTAVSENEPVMELNDDGTCVIHAIKPGVLSYTVNGTWNVENDSLLIYTDGVVASVSGDTTQVRVGSIPAEKSYKISDFNELTLTLRRDGNDYTYVRRGHNAELEKQEAKK